MIKGFRGTVVKSVIAIFARRVTIVYSPLKIILFFLFRSPDIDENGMRRGDGASGAKELKPVKFLVD